ncbi:S-phase kinase-associated protein 2-like [Mizuhopecten yessoensis]|uniref:S-phase kinase-associated protein 2 n=1 Tax=Mizuhopecten yessoensis TaxID=6573 RepID=A0A210PNZ5_MIZYE|nr:S-phase kinase-associated protein 2-like [Mizuhopecten yessoensis]OWF38166.1 S-phase kinase-associated protein 2 [Mizuhopecten yessoensis]
MGKSKALKKSMENDQKENGVQISRKRKASGQLQPPRTKIMWSFNDNDTDHLYKELGVGALSSESSSSDADSITELTPTVVKTNASQVVPGAPKILQPSQCLNTSGSERHGSLSLYVSSPVNYSRQKSKCDISICDTQGIDYFGGLSDEIILAVFRWLPKFTLAKCSRVCHRWNRLVSDDSLWKRVDLSNKTIAKGTLGNILNRGVQLLRLTKSEVEGPLFSGFTSIIKSTRLSKIQYLDLSMASVPVSVLEELFSVCRDLKKVSLEHCQLSDEVCQHIGENKNLEVINLAMCQGITSAGLMPITTNCRRLESLNMAWSGLQRHSVVYLSLCLPSSLRKLNLSGLRENITDEEVLQLVKTCPGLRELDLSDCTILTCSSIDHIANHLNRLEYLALSRCYRVLPSTIPNLNQLDSMLAVDVFGMLREGALQQLREAMFRIEINKFPFSSIARPTTGIRRTSIWGLRVRDIVI